MSSPSDIKDLDQFLAQLSEGEEVSSGSFSLSAEKMLSKLAQAVTELDSWILKLLQAAVASRAGYFVVKTDRRSLKIQVTAKQHFDITPAQDLLTEVRRTTSHHHLLLSLVWLEQTPHFRRAQVRWSSPTSVEQLTIEDGDFHGTTIAIDEELPHRFLEVILERGPSTLVERIFRKTNFVDELLKLERRSYFAPLLMTFDGRALHQAEFDSRSLGRGLFDRPGSSNLPRFPYPRRLSRFWDKETRYKHRLLAEMEGRTPEATAYAEVIPRKKVQQPSKIHWVVDGAVIQVDDCMEHYEYVFLIFLSAKGLTTDVSTLALTEDEQLPLHRKDQALWTWCSGIHL